MKKRTSGVLLNISSLPSPFGVGVFGEEARRWIDSISEMGFSNWQILPLGLLDSGNSPYASISAFAGNYLYIDPRILAEKGLICEKTLKDSIYGGTPYTADYVFAKEKRLAALKEAFSNLTPEYLKAVEEYRKDNPKIEEYAFYVCLKELNDEKPWWEWDKRHAVYKSALEQISEYSKEIDFWVYVQYLFNSQWQALKSYANERRVSIIGDMPIYVARDSADVWANLNLFMIDEDSFQPKDVAGVPPDYFSADGQLWGNPLYNWKLMKKDGYKWWMSRIESALELYDTVRIDHFRAFASYWAVPFKAKSAKEGRWEKGPGKDFFDTVFKCFEAPSIIAEDLGEFGEDVVELLVYTGLAGMRVIQFGFDCNGDSTHMPHNYPSNSVAYVGTHDNNTLLGYLWEATPEERQFALDYCGFEGEHWEGGGYKAPACRKIIETVWRSPSATAIIAFQDMCGFGSDARMNIPGVPENNWRFRTTEETVLQIDKAYFKKLNRVFKRLG